MPDSQTFVYDEVAFIDFFNSLPTVRDEWGHDVSYSYETQGIRATFGFNLITGDCSLALSLSSAESPFVTFVYLDRPSIEIKNGREGPSIQVTSPGNSGGLQFWVKPSICVEHFSGQSR